MVHAKNYEIVSTFVKVMQKKRWPLFSGHGVDSCCDWLPFLLQSSLPSEILYITHVLAVFLPPTQRGS